MPLLEDFPSQQACYYYYYHFCDHIVLHQNRIRILTRSHSENDAVTVLHTLGTVRLDTATKQIILVHKDIMLLNGQGLGNKMTALNLFKSKQSNSASFIRIIK